MATSPQLVPSPLGFQKGLFYILCAVLCSLTIYTAPSGTDLQLYISGCKCEFDVLVDRLNDDMLAVLIGQALFVAKASTSHTLQSLYLGWDSIEWTEQIKNLVMTHHGRLRFSGYQ
jgi:hypothetical protein